MSLEYLKPARIDDVLEAAARAGALGGKAVSFDLSDQLKQGPVVLYFYPAAFTPGCTIEARLFAEATDDFKKLGATVVGVSRDEIGKLQKFSLSECRSKFAVASDQDGRITRSISTAKYSGSL